MIWKCLGIDILFYDSILRLRRPVTNGHARGNAVLVERVVWINRNAVHAIKQYFSMHAYETM